MFLHTTCRDEDAVDFFSVPIDRTEGIQMLYVFVDIKIDTVHFIETLKHNFDPGTSLALVSTIQFVTALQVSILYSNQQCIYSNRNLHGFCKNKAGKKLDIITVM